MLQSMKTRLSSGKGISPEPGTEAPRAGRGAAGRAVAMVLAACAAAAIVAGGCNPLIRNPGNEAEFREVLDTSAGKPVVIDFFKGGCASCMFLEGTIDQLSKDYEGRVVVVRYELMRFWLEITSMPIWKEYRIGIYPTVVLMVDGKEKKRWIADYNINNYRKVLTELVGPPAPKDAAGKAAEGKVEDTAKSPPANDKPAKSADGSVDKAGKPAPASATP